MKEKHELQRSYDQIAAQYAAAFAREHTERDCFFLCHHSPDTGRGGDGFARICASLTAGWLPLTRLSWGRGRNPFFRNGLDSPWLSMQRSSRERKWGSMRARRDCATWREES